MKRPNLPTGKWNHSKHGTPEGYPQFGIYADGAPNDFAIVKAEEPVAQAISVLPDLLAALEESLLEFELHAEALQFKTGKLPPTHIESQIKSALTKAGYTF